MRTTHWRRRNRGGRRAYPGPPDSAPVSDVPSAAHRAVLADALRLVREQAARLDRDPTAAPLAEVAAEPFGLGYLFGAVDALCQGHGAPFDGMALAVYALALDAALGREAPDVRDRALDLHELEDPTFKRGRRWGGNEATGWKLGRHTPEGLLHLARGDGDRMR